MISFESARRAVVAENGEPERVWSFRRGDGVPASLDVLAYPVRARKKRAPKVFLYTAGFATVLLPGPVPRVELLLRVQGEPSEEATATLARELADLCARLGEHRVPLAHRTLLDDVAFSTFPGKTTVLVEHAVFDEGTPLPEAEEPTLVMRLCPVTPTEAMVLATGPTDAVWTAWLRDGLEPTDPERRSWA